MTLRQDCLLTEEEDPLMALDLNSDEAKAFFAHRELVRLQSVESYKTSPVHQALAAKDPDYWNNFSAGQNFLHPS